MTRNKISDVRDHLVAMLEQLGDSEIKPEVIERAKASSNVAAQYIAAVKVEIDARRLIAEHGAAIVGNMDMLPTLEHQPGDRK